MGLMMGVGSIQAAWKPTLSATVDHNDNVTRSLRDEKSDFAAAADIDFSTLRILNRDWQGHLAGFARTRHWQDWSGLDQTEAGVRTGLRRKFGLGPYAPRLDLSVEGARVFAATSPWTGHRLAASLRLQRRFTPIVTAAASVALDRFDARRSTYSGTGYTAQLGADLDLTREWRLALSARFREGDRTAWCRESWPEITGGPHWQDGIFGGDWFPYRARARTSGVTASLARAIGSSTTIAASIDASESKASKGRNYSTQVLSLQFIHVF